MSTTRHLVNRRRRLAHAGAARAATELATNPLAPSELTPSELTPVSAEPAESASSTDSGTASKKAPRESGKQSSREPGEPGKKPPRASGKQPPPGPSEDAVSLKSPADAPDLEPGEASAPGRSPMLRPSVLRLPGAAAGAALRRVASVPAPVVLCVLIVLLGAFAGLAASRADTLSSDPAARNAALTDPARTSEVKGQTEKAVAALFSYNYADTAAADKAASTLLTGKAVEQHSAMLAAVRAQGKDQKLVLTTTVTESGVEMIDGSRARVLVYADQSSTRTSGKKPETTYAAAMFAVDVVRGSGSTWKVSGIDTFGQGA